MKTAKLYNDLSYTIKEEAGFPMNYMQLSRVQQEFVESLTEALSTESVNPDLAEVRESLQDLNEDLLTINEELVRLMNELR